MPADFTSNPDFNCGDFFLHYYGTSLHALKDRIQLKTTVILGASGGVGVGVGLAHQIQGEFKTTVGLLLSRTQNFMDQISIFGAQGFNQVEVIG